jgi:hypothetical protein
LGKLIRLNRHELTIVGVAPPEFRGTTVGFIYDVWMPITMANEMGTGGGTLNYRGCRDLTSTLVRLKPGVTIDQARVEVGALADGRRCTMPPAGGNWAIQRAELCSEPADSGIRDSHGAACQPV